LSTNPREAGAGFSQTPVCHSVSKVIGKNQVLTAANTLEWGRGDTALSLVRAVNTEG